MKRAILFSLAAVILACGVGATRAKAGVHPHSRESFVIGIGVGGGVANIDFVDVSGQDNDENGGVGYFRFGRAVGDNLILGLEASGWGTEKTIDGDDTDWAMGYLAATLTWFPGNGGTYLRGGAGFAGTEFKAVQGARTVSEEEDGFVLLGALGYEWRVTKHIALGPQIEYAYLHIDGDLVDNAGYASGSIQLNYYW
jgi:hypothetical protein